ncbi:hypothetical protein ACHAXT_004994 [Thalassiosira profunda]
MAAASMAESKVPLALGVAVSALQLLVWRSRAVARLLEKDAERVWSDGSMMLDCSDEQFQRCVLQSALERAEIALESDAESNSARTGAPRFYQSGSSSGLTSEGEAEGTAPNLNGHNPPRMPRRMTKQVGGIASHKRPVLALDGYILKPLRLLHKPRIATGKDAADDKTKTHRGIREVAFYEALEFAAMVPTDSKCNTVPTSCRHPCIGYRSGAQFRSEDTTQSQPIPDTSLPQHLGYVDTLALSVAIYAGDSRVLSSVQSYANAWRCLAKEMRALKGLSKFTAPYFGVLDLDGLEGGRQLQSPTIQPVHRPHLLLQNLTVPFRRPNIIDIKMGTQTYEPAAPLAKQRREAGKYPPQETFGFRIVGMRVHSAADDQCQCWDKSFGVGLKTSEEVVQALATFFCCGDSNGSTSYTLYVLSGVIEQLAQLMQWFEEDNSTLAFYASSILIVYDGSQPYATIDRYYQDPIVKMIDMAHVCHQSGGDAGYLKGLDNLSRMLKAIKLGLG